MKEGIKPIYCKRPNWGPAQRRFLKQWIRKALKQGLMEPAPKSTWASRPVLVTKYRGDSVKGSTPDDMRACVDFTAVNEYTVNLPTQYTDPIKEDQEMGICHPVQHRDITVMIRDTIRMNVLTNGEGM